jgi:Flp pilus assembly protein TadG
MPSWSPLPIVFFPDSGIFRREFRCLESRGQTLVEFTLIFVLFVVVAWIPADFGLAFYTFHLAQNATREGARIAAAERVAPTADSCILGLNCSSKTGPLKATADRLTSALLRGATISVTLDPPSSPCNQNVTVRVDGQYRYFFYSLLRFMGISVLNPAPLRGSTSMRWEHQC